MLRWFQALMPREERFFALFSRHAQTIVDGADALREMLKGGDGVALAAKRVMDFAQVEVARAMKILSRDEPPRTSFLDLLSMFFHQLLSVLWTAPLQTCLKPIGGSIRGEDLDVILVKDLSRHVLG